MLSILRFSSIIFYKYLIGIFLYIYKLCNIDVIVTMAPVTRSTAQSQATNAFEEKKQAMFKRKTESLTKGRITKRPALLDLKLDTTNKSSLPSKAMKAQRKHLDTENVKPQNKCVRPLTRTTVTTNKTSVSTYVNKFNKLSVSSQAKSSLQAVSKVESKVTNVKATSSLGVRSTTAVSQMTKRVTTVKIAKQEAEKVQQKLPTVALPKIEEKIESVETKPQENDVIVTRSRSLKKESSQSESSSLYTTASEDACVGSDTEKIVKVVYKGPPVSDFDKELLHDPHQLSIYAMDIFEYLKSREANFVVKNYMPTQPGLSRNMRALLVDWMVEVQENFELNHETLYLAVRLVDMFLCKIKTHKERLQLVGATALFLACKYDERLCPMMDDFIQICDQAYSQDDLLRMEELMLRAVNFEFGVPISYRFLRRYGRCAKVQMPLLTLARFILELSLMDYNAIALSESKKAAASLYLALRMVNHSSWTETLEYYTGYKLNDFKDIVVMFNNMLHENHNARSEQLTVIKNKYSHKVFFEVAKTPLLSNDKLNLH